MKKIRFFTVLIMLLCSLCLFAEGSAETLLGSKETKVNNSLLTNYLDKINEYNNQYEKLCVELQMAYDKGDSQAYVDARKALRSLQAPVLSKEDSQLIEEDVVKNNDFETANLLYQYSRYYRPSITMISEETGFSYKSSVSVNPGSNVTLPELKMGNKAMRFAGWGLEQGVVTYKAGETIPMPLSNTTLYAVFEMDPSVKNGPSMLIELEDSTLNRGSVQNFKFNLKNNGTEDLRNVVVSFESDDPYLVILTDSLTSRYFESCDSAVASFQVVTKAAVGTQLSGTITVKDAQDNIWSEDVTLTVK